MSDPAEHIERWRRAGLIDETLAAQLTAFESRAAAAKPSLTRDQGEDRPGVIEALLYLGLVIAGAGIFFLIAQQWDELESWARVLMIGVPTALALAAGGGMHLSAEPGVRRGGHVAWLLAVALIAGTLAVAFNEFGPEDGIDDERWMLLVVGVITLVAALLLWAIAPSNPQVLAVGGAAFFFGQTLGAWPDDYTQRLAGTTIALSGVVLIVLTEAEIFQPRPIARVIAALLLCGGAYEAGIDSAWGWELLAFIAGAAVIAAGVARASFTYIAVGVGTLLVALITFMFEHFEDRIGAPVALMISGGMLVATVLVLVQVRNIVRTRRAIA